MPILAQKARQNLETNWEPLSETMFSGMPCKRTTCWKNNGTKSEEEGENFLEKKAHGFITEQSAPLCDKTAPLQFQKHQPRPETGAKHLAGTTQGQKKNDASTLEKLHSSRRPIDHISTLLGQNRVTLYDYQAMCKMPYHHHSGGRSLLNPLFALISATQGCSVIWFVLEFSLCPLWSSDPTAEAHKHKKHDMLQPCDTEYPAFIHDTSIREANGLIECGHCQRMFVMQHVAQSNLVFLVSDSLCDCSIFAPVSLQAKECERMRSQKLRRRPHSCHAFHPEENAQDCGRGTGLSLSISVLIASLAVSLWKMAAAISICARAASRSHFPEAPCSRALHLRMRGPRKMAAPTNDRGNSADRALFLHVRAVDSELGHAHTTTPPTESWGRKERCHHAHLT
ncbi:unnamed protein product [Ranitomeya imitator]|uniref:Voltage-dependent calcium channel alpha-2/delta subunit conserved region domain-containing protein n=1 Tax=Ranitomeya imitator TaxID=111125 RepID=A0ABN9L4H8_9NEOB|nr:unnamed protein product [Ranitomeya imitator]